MIKKHDSNLELFFGVATTAAALGFETFFLRGIFII
jgi:hypothetical protein